MDDLISRALAIDATEDPVIKGYVMNALKSVPSIPAVPLDKLCEWLANSFSDPPCCVLENVQCKMECRGFTQMAYSECWRYVLIKWMEGLDDTNRYEDA